MTKIEKIKYFESEVKRFYDFFGLHFWDLSIKQYETDKYEASCWTNPFYEQGVGCGFRATITYGKKWIESDITKDDISKTCFHEILELLLTRMRDFANQKEIYVSSREVDDEIHRIINTLENKIYRLIK